MKPNEWISLEIERPEIATWVLGLCTKGSSWKCFRANGGWYINTNHGQMFILNTDRDKKIEIVYWTHIPKMPTELEHKLYPERFGTDGKALDVG